MSVKPPVAPRIDGAVFAAWCEDGPESAERRRVHLDGHLNYVERWHDRYLVAGPLRRSGEPDLVGSLFVVRAYDEEDARRFLDGDPYFSEGVFKSVAIRHFMPAAGVWMGGVIWESADSLRPIADGRRR